MKAMTWNLRLGIQRGLEAVAEIIAETDSDVVAIQEVGRHWIMGPKGDTTAWLAKRLGYKSMIFVPCLRLAGGAEYGHALLSKHRLVAPRVTDLPMQVDEPRRLLIARCEAPDGPLDIASTHLSHIGDRDLQGPVLLEQARGLSNPALILGDLNTPHADWLSELMQHFVDSDPNASLTFPAGSAERRIDFILGSGVRFVKTEVLDSGDVSDHYPIVTRFERPLISS